MEWWIWVLIGLGLLVLEVATPGGFVALFFGLSGIVVGGLAAIGVAQPLWLQLILFSVLSVAALGLLRKPLQAKLSLGPRRAVDTFDGEGAVALTDLGTSEVGSVELRGTTWTARNAGSVAIAKGQRCLVERREGLTLFVRPE
jgi:membrane protein implicated in regulation of membrane protease activity